MMVKNPITILRIVTMGALFIISGGLWLASVLTLDWKDAIIFCACVLTFGDTLYANLDKIVKPDMPEDAEFDD